MAWLAMTRGLPSQAVLSFAMSGWAIRGGLERMTG